MYGEKELMFAYKEGAIKDFMISDGLLRSNDFKKRKKFETLVNKMEREGINVFIFNDSHVSG